MDEIKGILVLKTLKQSLLQNETSFLYLKGFAGYLQPP